MAPIITIKTNIAEVLGKITGGLELLKDKEYLLRPLAVEVIPLMTERIHQKGLASDEKPIGTYSPEYMKVRTGDYGNSGVYAKGAKKGQKKDSGVYTKGKNKGQPREKYNRSTDTKVIISLTRQLENDWAVLENGNGYAIGFLNELNFKKAGWVEETYKKKIFDLSETEKQYIAERVQELVAAATAI
jgi:hypothetical protein